MMGIEMFDELEKAKSEGCSGPKSPAECPCGGLFDPDNPACRECEEDALEAMRLSIMSEGE
jgi:hypothetical protein